MSESTARENDPRNLATFRRDLLLTSCLVAFVFAAVMSVAVFVPLAARLDRTRLDDEAIVGLADYVLFLHSAFWPVVALSLISCIVAASLLYRRMRSPLVRFVRVYREIEAGNRVPEPLRLRTYDYLSEEGAALNEMLAALASRAEARRGLVDRLCEIEVALAEQGADASLVGELREITKDPALRAGWPIERGA